MASLLLSPLLALLAWGGAACSTLEVHSDYDPRADFAQYRTYSWAPDAASKPASDISGVPSDLMESRIRAAIESQLGTRGLKQAKGGEKPDLLVRDQFAQSQQVEATGAGYSLGLGYGYGPWYGAFGGPSFPSVRQYTQGTLVIDLIDAETKRLVWRGIASDETAAPDESTEQINEVVAETLQKYPPRPVGQG